MYIIPRGRIGCELTNPSNLQFPEMDNITRNTVKFLGEMMAVWSWILRVLIF